MNCMKCGRETPSEQVFCEECLQEMEKYPVKPGTVVLLPRRREAAAPKKQPKRRILSPEEQVRILRKWVRWMAIALCVCVVLIGLMIYPTVHFFKHDHFEIGQNYNTIVTPVPSESVPAVN